MEATVRYLLADLILSCSHQRALQQLPVTGSREILIRGAWSRKWSQQKFSKDGKIITCVSLLVEMTQQRGRHFGVMTVCDRGWHLVCLCVWSGLRSADSSSLVTGKESEGLGSRCKWGDGYDKRGLWVFSSDCFYFPVK